MANTMLDLRRTDQRRQTLENPFWSTSGIIAPAADDKEAVLWSFPLTGGFVPNRGVTLITGLCCEIVTGFAGGTITLDIGIGSIPLETTTTDGTVTVTDADEFIPTADVANGTPGIYFPNGGDWHTVLVAGTFLAPVQIVGLDATVKVIYATLASDAAITAGAARIHALMHNIPLMG